MEAQGTLGAMRVDAWLPRAARAHPGRAAVNELTYAQLDAAVERAARVLHARGAGPGRRVALALPPGEAFAVALHATQRVGALAVPVDLRLTPEERPAGDVTVSEDEPLKGGDELPPAPAAGAHELGEPAILVHTSGTTSAPKPVPLTYGNWLWSALGSGVALGVHPQERWLSALPLSHVGGLSILMRSAICGTTALVHERFETDRVLHALRHDGVTVVSLVPTTLARLLDAGLAQPPALRCALIGGGPVPPELLRRARRAGVPVAQTYGLSEACSQVTTARPGDEQPDAGPPLFCTRVRTAADGEIEVAGPTLATSGPDGWLATGDLGKLDGEGRLRVTGRKADTIVTGGENVAPTEVEAVLAEHPAVAEAAVHARPDPDWGEAVVATVVLRDGMRAQPADLIAHCAARLARFKVPKQVGFARELPRTRSGKLLRRAL
jgi:O-succinylbenzoic acid--CoA ligase